MAQQRDSLSVDDLAYLVPESNAAWLEGRGDGRAEVYEAYYVRTRMALADRFDLQTANDEYPQWIARRPSSLLRALNAPAIGKALVTLVVLSIAARAVPHLALRLPMGTGGALAAVFALRIFVRRRARSAV
jgi:hypothetical protein